MNGHAIKGFNHEVLGLTEISTLGPGFFSRNTRATPSVFWFQKPVPRAGFSDKPSTPWLKPITQTFSDLFFHSYTWDTPLRKLLKDFRLSTPPLTSGVTLRDILAHRTGIPSPFLPMKVGMFPNTTREDFMRWLQCTQADTWHNNNVNVTSKRRGNVGLT